MLDRLSRYKFHCLTALLILAAVLFFALPTRLASGPEQIEALRMERLGENPCKNVPLTEEQAEEIQALLAQARLRRSLSNGTAIDLSPFEIELSFLCGQKPFHLLLGASAGKCCSSGDDLIQYSVIDPQPMLAWLNEILN